MIKLATKYKWNIHQLDVNSCFLNRELKEEIYLVQSKGFLKKDQYHLVCKIKEIFICVETCTNILVCED